MADKKVLVLAEKPSAGRDLARILKVSSKQNKGFVENDRYVISWMIGHLLGYAYPDEQNPAWKKWSFNTLPMFPENFLLKEIKSSASQLGVLKKLFSRKDISEIIVATDAAREGELIFRHVYNYFKCKLPFRRLWVLDNTDSGIKKAMANVKPGSHYDNLAYSAKARAEADWLVGMNFSRAYSLKGNDRYSIGRVQTPVLALLVDRRKAIDNFVSVPFYLAQAQVLTSGNEEFEAQVMRPPDYKQDRFEQKKDAEAQAAKINGQAGIIQAITKKDTNIPPPLLYDLTALQKEANSRYGFSAKETLSYAQKLYEGEKVITYPRTDSKHITKDIFKEINTRLDALPQGYMPLIDLVKKNLGVTNKFACVNDKKVTDHYAIIPTEKTPASTISQELKLTYNLVARRFLAAFMPAAKVQNTRLTIDVQGEKLQSSGKIFKVVGWIEAEPWRKSDDVVLPELAKGDQVKIDSVEVKQSKTKAPPHFTEKTLLAAMESGDFTVSQLQDNEDIMGLVDQSSAVATVGIGRPSTRAAIIELLIDRGYVERRKKQLVATDVGIKLIDFVQETLPALCSAKVTHAWEESLEKIARGNEQAMEFMEKIKIFINDGIKVMGAQKERGVSFSQTKQLDKNDLIGTCPLCGQEVYSKFGGKVFGCLANNRRENPDCAFVIFPQMYGGKITKTLAREILKNGVTTKPVKLKNKAGKEYQAKLHIREGKVAPLLGNN
ncbi:type IA DNA topoisomerase [Desulfonatronovibrio magnus]|uniref:type IA DNA topoisomerase n=1 Tax=Desulfonatronovibrio magnus TaxID=698827 RepID=UPI0006974C3F|nr:type IA DNA topoisomerase [Desulfonatronovibrio magnus]